MRTLAMKRETIMGTVEYLRTLPDDSEINELLSVLEVAADSFLHGMESRSVSEVRYYTELQAKELCAELLADHIDSYSETLEDYTVLDTPVDIVQLIFLTLSDSLDQLSHRLLLGRRTKNWSPITDLELAALEKYGLMA